MDCGSCKTRGAVESCSECHTLLCEVCLINCERCGKVVCPDHIHKTSSGRIICVACQAERKAKAKQRDKVSGAADAEMPDVPVTEETPEEEILVASVRKPPPPWKLSVYAACAAIALALFLFLFPSLRSFRLPWGGFFSAAYPFLVIPAVSILWAVIGLRSVESEYIPDRPKCMLGAGLAVLGSILLIFAALTDPARVAENKALEDQKKSLERPAAERRENIMNRFTQPEQPRQP